MRSPWLLMKSSTWASYYSNPKKIPRLVFPGCQFDIVRWYMSFIFHDIFHFWPLFWRLRPKKRWPGLAFFNHGIGWNPPPKRHPWARTSGVDAEDQKSDLDHSWLTRLPGLSGSLVFWWVPWVCHGWWFLRQQSGWLQTFPVLGINNDNCAILMIMYWPNQLKMS